jgi:hypothetical protein
VQENLKEYLKLSFTPVSDTVICKGNIENIISQKNITTLGQKEKDKLAEFFTELLVSKSSGDFKRYKRTLGTGIKATIRGNLANLEQYYRRWMNKDLPSHANAEQIAKETFLFENSYEEGGTRLTHCSFDVNGIRLRHAKCDSPINLPNTTRSMSDDEGQYWLGPIVVSANVLYRPVPSLQSVLSQETSVEWIDFFIIVKTQNDDTFPLRIRCWYHPKLKHWVVAGVDKQSSIKAANSPPMTI